MCRGHHRTCERLWNFSLSSLRKKKWHRNKELTMVEFEPGTAGSEITELPTKHEALDEFSWLKRLFVFGFFVLCCCLSVAQANMMDLGKRSCLQEPTRRTAPVNDQCCVLKFCRPEIEAGIEHFYRTTSVNSCTLFPFSSFPKNIVSPE